MYIPNVVKKLDNRRLKALYKFLRGTNSSVFEFFSKQCLESSTKSLAERKPEGTNLDYYNWGFLQGVKEVHDLYSKLGNHCGEEIMRRNKEGNDTIDTGDE